MSGVERTVKFDISINTNGQNNKFILHQYSSDGNDAQEVFNTGYGQNMNTTIIRDLDDTDSEEIFFRFRLTSNSDNGIAPMEVLIDNFTVNGSKSTGALRYNNSTDHTLKNSSIINSISGALIENSVVSIKNCVFYDNDYAGLIVDNSNGTVKFNYLGHNHDLLGNNSDGLVLIIQFSNESGQLSLK